jgi:hypothetical protein
MLMREYFFQITNVAADVLHQPRHFWAVGGCDMVERATMRIGALGRVRSKGALAKPETAHLPTKSIAKNVQEMHPKSANAPQNAAGRLRWTFQAP